MSKNILYIIAILALYGCGAHLPKSPNHQQPPNIVLIFTDDQGYGDVGCYGAQGYETPHLDQMAREGARLTQFYTAQPVCSAARAALLTGCYSNRVGIHQALMPNAPIGLHPDETTIADMLKAQGYATAIMGKWHLGDAPQFMPNKQGFDAYFGIPYSGDMWAKHPQQGSIFKFGPLPLYENERPIDTLEDQSQLTTLITERSVAFIEKNCKKPFFLYVPHPQPHVPLYVSDKFRGKSKQGLYGDVIMELDWSVGQILETLKKHQLDKNTLVIFTSDNGPWLAYGNHSGSSGPLREGKGTVWEGGVREPCIVRMPGTIPAGSVVHTPLMTIDWLPTIAALTGATLPVQKIDGKNALPILKGTSQIPPHTAFCFYYNHNELQAVRYLEWKLYFPHTYRSMGTNPPGQNGLPGNYLSKIIKTPELYNLNNDIGEAQNVAAQYPEIIAQIMVYADSMRTQLGDQLLKIEGKENRQPGRLR